jgi:class 3 adenylate cyclase
LVDGRARANAVGAAAVVNALAVAVVLVLAGLAISHGAFGRPGIWAVAAATAFAGWSTLRLPGNRTIIIADAFYIPALVAYGPRGGIVVVAVGIAIQALSRPAPSWFRTLFLAGMTSGVYLTAALVVSLVGVPAGGLGRLFGVTSAAFAGALVGSIAYGWLISSVYVRQILHPLVNFDESDREAAPIQVAIELPISLAVAAWVAAAPWFALLMYLPFLASTVVGRRSAELDNRVAFLRSSFSRYVPEAVVDTLVESGEHIELGGAEREVSVLFCDIRGFTAWSETLGASEVIEQLNELLGDLAGAVFETQGTLDKFTGDGLMAFWGAPLEQPDHAERAARAARHMVEALHERNRSRCDAGLPALAIGIGIHSGPAVVGNVGSESRHDYTAIGDTVNTAARLEAATREVGAIAVVSAATWSLLSAELRVDGGHHGGVSVKGKREPIDTHVLIPLAAAGADERAA